MKSFVAGGRVKGGQISAAILTLDQGGGVTDRACGDLPATG